MENYQSGKFKKWLDHLQQESWQLELIISGFAIYGLFSAVGPIELKSNLSAVNGNLLLGIGIYVLLIVIYILLFNLTLHVLVRGLWIGAIGLRYVSGDINYDSLRYSQKFTLYLKKKVGSFDRYIEQLENYCSILFALSFLLIFYVIGAITSLVLIPMLGSLLINFTGNVPKYISSIYVVFNLLYLLTSILVLIDFLGQGMLKRRNWTSVIYFPIYRIFSILTLSFLYRPLIYNFLDNKFGRRLSFLLIPVYIAIVIIGSLEYRNSNFLDQNADSSQYLGSLNNYEDQLLKDDEFADIATIPSKVIESNYLKVFLVYEEKMEDFIFEKNESLIPLIDLRGWESSINVDFKRGMEHAKGSIKAIDYKSYLQTFKELYRIKIDNNCLEGDFIISSNSKKRLGFETYLNIQNLSNGKHFLTITGPAKENVVDKKSKTIEKTLATIPFWYYPTQSTAIEDRSNIAIKDSLP